MMPLYRTYCIYNPRATGFGKHRGHKLGAWQVIVTHPGMTTPVSDPNPVKLGTLMGRTVLVMLVPRALRHGSLVNPLELLKEYLAIVNPHGSRWGDYVSKIEPPMIAINLKEHAVG